MYNKNVLACIKPEWDKGVVRKRIAISGDHNSIIPISTYNPETMTHYQVVRSGDCIFAVTLDLKTGKVRSELVLVHAGRTMICPTFKNLDTKAILERMTDINNILFSDFGSFVDLEYSEMTDIENIKPYEEFLTPMKEADEEMYDYVIQQLNHSKAIDVLMDWDLALQLPSWLNNRSRLTTDKDDRTIKHTSEHWLLRRKDGSWYIPDLEPTKGAHISAETQRTLKVYDHTPLAMPDDVDRAIKFILGAYVIDGNTCGVSWALYKR